MGGGRCRRLGVVGRILESPWHGDRHSVTPGPVSKVKAKSLLKLDVLRTINVT